MILEKIFVIAAIGFMVIFYVGPIIAGLVYTIWEVIMDMKRDRHSVFVVWLVTVIAAVVAFAAIFFWYSPKKYDEGYKAGYDAGCSKGYSDARSQGYDNGYQAGKTAGYDEGNLAGFERGRKAGYDEGYDTGFQDGASDAGNSAAAETGNRTVPDNASSEAWAPPADRWVPAGIDPGQIVYVSNKSHTIHESHYCSGMRNYFEMTFRDAVDAGYTFCLNCW